jgi:ABC-type transport system involved in multi-copper enzyme maturation permease subunit
MSATANPTNPSVPWWGAQVRTIALNTFREAVRDRVLYNLIAFALLLVGAAILVGQISVGVERLVVVNLGLTAISLFGIVIAILIGIGLVSKEIEKKTVYTLLTRPVGRWQFIFGKFCGLVGTLAVNAFLMSVGFFAALLYVTHKFHRADAWLLVAIYFILLELMLLTALALLFSSFSSPLLSAIFAFAVFVIGTFATDLRSFASAAQGAARWLGLGLAYLVPNFSAFNVIVEVAHEQPVAPRLILWNTVYALLYSGAAIAGAMLIFERRNLK